MLNPLLVPWSAGAGFHGLARPVLHIQGFASILLNPWLLKIRAFFFEHQITSTPLPVALKQDLP